MTIRISKEELEDYVKDHSIDQTAKHYHCHRETIRKRIKQYNIRYTKHKGIFYHDYFKTWSHNMAYILGFITADGSVHNKRAYITIDLARKDECVLKFILSEIYPTGNIYYYDRFDKRTLKTYYICKICLYSQIIKNDLEQYSIFPNKTCKHKINFNIPQQYVGDYIRGYFDGDGSCMIHHPHGDYPSLHSKFSCGSINFLNDLLQLLNISDIKVYQNTIPPEIRFYTHNSLKLFNIMYVQHNRFCLQRKKNIFLHYIKDRVNEYE